MCDGATTAEGLGCFQGKKLHKLSLHASGISCCGDHHTPRNWCMFLPQIVAYQMFNLECQHWIWQTRYIFFRLRFRAVASELALLHRPFFKDFMLKNKQVQTFVLETRYLNDFSYLSMENQYFVHVFALDWSKDLRSRIFVPNLQLLCVYMLQEPKLVRNLFGTCSGFVRVSFGFSSFCLFLAIFSAELGRNLFGTCSGFVRVSVWDCFFAVPASVNSKWTFSWHQAPFFISFSTGNLSLCLPGPHFPTFLPILCLKDEISKISRF